MVFQLLHLIVVAANGRGGCKLEDELAMGRGARGPKRFGSGSLRSLCGASRGGFTSLLFFFIFL
jgi:hypothetical protein